MVIGWKKLFDFSKLLLLDLIVGTFYCISFRYQKEKQSDWRQFDNICLGKVSKKRRHFALFTFTKDYNKISALIICVHVYIQILMNNTIRCLPI